MKYFLIEIFSHLQFMADFVARTQASYLEFIFRREMKVNLEKFSQEKPHVRLTFPDSPHNEDTDSLYVGSVGEASGEEVEICSSYANHGHCGEGEDCNLSHNIDLIVSQKTEEQHKKWRKRKAGGDLSCNGSNGSDGVSDGKQIKLGPGTEVGGSKPDKLAGGLGKSKTGCHRAGYDAFMTGFCLTTFLVHHTKIPLTPQSWTSAHLNTQKILNRIYLACKDFPLLVQKSAFAKCSGQHHLKLSRLGLCKDS